MHEFGNVGSHATLRLQDAVVDLLDESLEHGDVETVLHLDVEVRRRRAEESKHTDVGLIDQRPQ